MPCYHPLRGYRSEFANENGMYPVVFRPGIGASEIVDLPCGQCIGCRLERSRQWALRCMHEASLYDENCFVTFTYDDEHVPFDGSLNKDHFQSFMKRLRFHLHPERVRFYMCGEYGEQLSRPHYHALLFGQDFHWDRKIWKRERDHTLYRSDFLEDIWKLGMCVIGDLTFESAGYVARYCMKVVTGEKAKSEHYWKHHSGFDMMIEIEPEYSNMSRRPGIGADWLDEFSSDVFPSDECVSRGHPSRPPRYYDERFRSFHPEVMDEVKEKRKASSILHYDDNVPSRLRSKEKVCIARTEQLIRSL